MAYIKDEEIVQESYQSIGSEKTIVERKDVRTGEERFGEIAYYRN